MAAAQWMSFWRAARCLQRVRAALAARNGIADTPSVEPSDIIRRALAGRCARTFSRYGMEELHRLLHIDATLRLPPYAKCGFRGTALGVHKYLCSRPENLTNVAERIFVSDAQGEIFDAHGMRRRATVDLSCSFGTQKLRAPPAGHVPCGSALYFRSFSGQGIIAATRRPYGTDSVVLPKGEMTWLLAP
ncbi:hypothetical protein [Streptomyces sp. SID5770]|uniref:hypothetical protein n=1 Tax=Streptomyces sp. SID5770 TaxID=2690308 RepID=UPI0019267065|nr:hypothetical protein [Streptomyces sp. SID5770]